MEAGFPGCDCSHSNLLAHRMDRAERVTLGEKKIPRRTAIIPYAEGYARAHLASNSKYLPQITKTPDHRRRYDERFGLLVQSSMGILI